MKDTFSTYHPIINFLYFMLVVSLSMFLMHPLCLLLALAGAFAYSVYLKGRRAFLFGLKFMLPTMALTALMNPVFNHKGATILTYWPDGNPLTWESIAYGIAAAAMLATVVCWFSCYNEIMTSDKFVYLFGRVIPSLSLLFSMVLRFVPRFKKQMQSVSDAQKCIGRDASRGNLWERIRHGIRMLSIMVTWMLENAVDTADSMKGRGYGLKGRTAFSLYRFDSRDMIALAVILLAGGYVLLAGCIMGGLSFRYFPSMQGAGPPGLFISLSGVYGLLCAMPLVINIWEDTKWKRLQSGI